MEKSRASTQADESEFEISIVAKYRPASVMCFCRTGDLPSTQDRSFRGPIAVRSGLLTDCPHLATTRITECKRISSLRVARAVSKRTLAIRPDSPSHLADVHSVGEGAKCFQERFSDRRYEWLVH